MLDNQYIKSLKASTKEIIEGGNDFDLGELMKDAAYLRQSSSLINEALQKGFDVLQLENGDIVTTGTKTIVHQYTWDKAEGKLVRAKAPASSKGGKVSAFEDM